MLENPTEASFIANTTTVKRYAPPNQRNRSLGRKKSGVERSNNFHGNEGQGGEKNQSKNIPVMNNGDVASGSNHHLHHQQQQLISLSGCCNSEAYHLMKDRWNAAISSYNDTSIDLADRPVMYCSSVGPALPFRLPHQVTTPRDAAAPSQMDFLSELRQAMHNANSSSATFF